MVLNGSGHNVFQIRTKFFEKNRNVCGRIEGCGWRRWIRRGLIPALHADHEAAKGGLCEAE